MSNDGWPVAFYGEEFVVDTKEIKTMRQAIEFCKAAEAAHLKRLQCATIDEALKRLRCGVQPELQREQFGWRTIDGQFWFDEEQAREHAIVIGAEQRELRRLKPITMRLPA